MTPPPRIALLVLLGALAGCFDESTEDPVIVAADDAGMKFDDVGFPDDVPSFDAPFVDLPRVDVPMIDTPSVDAAAADASALDAGAPVEAAVDVPVADAPAAEVITGCVDDEGCASPTPHCDVGRHRCVVCTRSSQCATGASCIDQACVRPACPAGRGDCNGDPTDGCEADLARDVANCGACATHPTETCNLADDDCDGVCDNVDGCRVGVTRSNGSEHFYTTSPTEAVCCGFHVESANYFYVYSSAAPGAVALYRCAGGGKHFYTTRDDCEAAGTSEGVLGYIATGAACGAVPLYRLHQPRTGDNFYTIDAGERDSAVASGYQSIEVTGHVWMAPRG